jgi:hypothetical protein
VIIPLIFLNAIIEKMPQATKFIKAFCIRCSFKKPPGISLKTFSRGYNEKQIAVSLTGYKYKNYAAYGIYSRAGPFILLHRSF